jgi:hypothetical protein
MSCKHYSEEDDVCLLAETIPSSDRLILGFGFDDTCIFEHQFHKNECEYFEDDEK